MKRFDLEFVNVDDIDYCTCLDVIEKKDLKKDSHWVFTWDGKKLEFVK